ncbi:hypothetical protein TBLA_0D00550 [Henningerozyma blattae CBS 6284]|uniref:Glutamyl-tRNA(Gln) amidotransferase subunit B, mitochondrial n=1 Tax=Henningerozyma blattae (strain ATCC 34711 / CBS 6284 / DSM 70876 / NBRC 10599 / NRRL Y-10934 / UCD 77-7) TaxID=1071380 RepID=I2H2G1_HENB6|nr:hypothetical protein TBLA_0D00550 [Tetrapisispora blattae CBS 6284]CCH60563.1 hypothetical protein TBLA_0D00550 [Tetrapisispora blattae CBS 6284]
MTVGMSGVAHVTNRRFSFKILRLSKYSSRVAALQTLFRINRRSYSVQPEFKLKCGLEIHTQLQTKYKLFSSTLNSSLETKPNHNVSFYDAAIPGTQPILNYEPVIFATKLALALNSTINSSCSFDRKHYFYPDQPAGYQITQHFSPFAKGGCLMLYGDLDNIDEINKKINIIQIQIEQDTGKSIYNRNNSGDGRLVDLNRSNVPLIELVTYPDFTDCKQIVSFIKKYQNLVRHLHISTGDLETGALRVDVNVNVNDFPRVELKNLPNTSEISKAIKYEYYRQVDILKSAKDNSYVEYLAETRSWDGSRTHLLRTKETHTDYRYIPDLELPVVNFSQNFISTMKNNLGLLPDQLIRKLLAEPYCLSLKDARIFSISSNSKNNLYSHNDLSTYFFETFHSYSSLCKRYNIATESKLVVNWILHNLLGILNRYSIPLKSVSHTFLTPKSFSYFLYLIKTSRITNSTAKLMLPSILKSFDPNDEKYSKQINFDDILGQYDLAPISEEHHKDVQDLCRAILNDIKDQSLIECIVSGKKKNGLKFLIGQGMRKSQGRITSKEFELNYKKLLNIKW